MSTIPGYEGPAHPLSTPIEALTAVCTAPYNHRAVGIRNSSGGDSDSDSGAPPAATISA
jgi:hypothetical protein